MHAISSATNKHHKVTMLKYHTKHYKKQLTKMLETLNRFSHTNPARKLSHMKHSSANSNKANEIYDSFKLNSAIYTYI